MGYLPSRKAAEILGVHPNTLRKWADSGKIKHIRTASGQRKYDVRDYLGKNREMRTVCYCRVSGYKQKDDLQRQVEYMRKKFPEAEIVKDIGSGISFKRKGLRTILERAINGDKLRVVSAHGDRLARFGFDLIKWIIEKSDGELVVLNESELSPDQELTQDLLTILHVFSCRMHGLRSYKNQIGKAFSDR
ncbi:DNA invertase [Desulfonema ishimotonii]|uniref:DNA invertase n=1 Tax=Desulfonema ishimotonii TaxID=45657 RepID=A0A401FT31_9BACT|nr:DNA invertase [Desulfonema ishimotonii]